MENVQLIFDQKGKVSSKLEMTPSQSGTTIKVASTHLTILNEALWTVGCDRLSPCIGTMNEGSLNIAGITIMAGRITVPQDAIFFHISYTDKSNVSQEIAGLACEKGMSQIVRSLAHLKKNVYEQEGWYMGNDFCEVDQRYKDVIHNVKTHEIFTLPDGLLDEECPDICPETLFAFEKFLNGHVYPNNPSETMKKLLKHVSTHLTNMEAK